MCAKRIVPGWCDVLQQFATRPSAFSSPSARIATRSQTVSTSPSSCDEKRPFSPRASGVGYFAHLHPANRVEAARGFVEDQQVGIVDERLGQADPLLHALGIGPDGPPARRFQFHQLEHGVNAPFRFGRGIPKIRA